MISSLLPLILASGNPVAEIPKPPTASPEGEISIWGAPATEAVASAWAKEFEAKYPEIKVKLNLTGSDVGMAALYTGRADIVLMGRTPTSSEVKAFEWIFRYRPSLFPVALGSQTTPGQSPNVAILVHPLNPVERLSKRQLESVLLGKKLTWGDLGGSGGRAERPVRVYMPHAESGTGRFIREAIAGGDIRLDWKRITEFVDSPAMGARDKASVEAALAIRGDLDGVAFGVSGVDGTRQIETSSSASLQRQLFSATNIPPGECADPEVALFLKFAMSQSGNEILEKESDYRSLSQTPEEGRTFCAPLPKA